MNLNHYINQISWKLIAIIALTLFASSWVVREIMFWRFFHEFQIMTSQFNTQFHETQQAIHQKILNAENESEKWSKAFDQKQKEFHDMVDKELQSRTKFLQDSTAQMMEQQKRFDEKFEKMPGEMWQAHLNFKRDSDLSFQQKEKAFMEVERKDMQENINKEKKREAYEKRRALQPQN